MILIQRETNPWNVNKNLEIKLLNMEITCMKNKKLQTDRK